MPELPEVQTIVGDLKKVLIGKKVKNFTLNLAKRFYFGPIQPNQNGSGFNKEKAETLSQKILRQKITKIERFGKIIVINFQNWAEVIHLKLTGQLIYQAKTGTRISGGHPNNDFVASLPVKATNFIWEFADGSKLFFNDFRKFGYLQLLPKKDLARLPAITQLGPDALKATPTAKFLINKAKSKKRITIKQFLLDQKILAGIGNIYGDEVLFYAKVQPGRKVGSLKLEDFQKISQNISKVLKLAIKYRGTSTLNYRDPSGNEGAMGNHLRVYKRAGQSCRKCKTKIKSLKIGGRTSHWCPKCQK